MSNVKTLAGLILASSVSSILAFIPVAGVYITIILQIFIIGGVGAIAFGKDEDGETVEIVDRRLKYLKEKVDALERKNDENERKNEKNERERIFKINETEFPNKKT